MQLDFPAFKDESMIFLISDMFWELKSCSRLFFEGTVNELLMFTVWA
jgi:hypothetical protein